MKRISSFPLFVDMCVCLMRDVRFECLVLAPRKKTTRSSVDAVSRLVKFSWNKHERLNGEDFLA